MRRRNDPVMLPEEILSAFEPGERAIVVARYREDLAWLAPVARDVVVYNKCAEDNDVDLLPGCAERYNIRNVGRDAHTHLTYILDHWDALPPFVVFIQGRLDDCVVDGLWNGEKDLHSLLTSRDDVWRGARAFAGTHYAAGIEAFRIHAYQGIPLEDAGMNCGEFWRKHMPDEPFPQRCFWMLLAGASREAIRGVPRSTYESLLLAVSNSKDPEAVHFIERILCGVFEVGARRSREQQL